MIHLGMLSWFHCIILLLFFLPNVFHSMITRDSTTNGERIRLFWWIENLLGWLNKVEFSYGYNVHRTYVIVYDCHSIALLRIVFVSGRQTRAVEWFPRKRAVAELPDFNREGGILDRDPGIAFEHPCKRCERNSFRLCNLSLFYQVLELSTSGFRCWLFVLYEFASGKILVFVQQTFGYFWSISCISDAYEQQRHTHIERSTHFGQCIFRWIWTIKHVAEFTDGKRADPYYDDADYQEI